MQPILADEVQTFKALITVHKVLQEGHPVVRIHVTSTAPAINSISPPAESLRLSRKPTARLDGWKHVRVPWAMKVLEVSRVLVTTYGTPERRTGYGPLIRAYVQFILAKLRFHRIRPEFNGLFEYEEYVTLKGIDDPNEGCVSLVSGVCHF